MPWTCFLPCGNGSHGVRRAFFWSILQFELSAYDSTSPTVAFGYPYRAFRVRFRRFPEQGRIILAMSGLRMIRRPTVLPTRGGAGAVALQNTPFFARAGMGYLRRTRRYPVNICNLYRELCKSKRRAVWVGVSGCLAHQNGELPHAPYTLSECENGLTRCQA